MAPLAKKAFVGLVGLQVAMTLLLFLPAGTVRWWQGWLYWLVFLAGVLVITVFLLKTDPALVERRLRAGPAAEHRPWQKVAQGIAQLAFMALLAVPGLDRRLGWTSVAGPVSLVADAVVAVCFGFLFWVLRENSYASSTVTISAGQRVVSTGPYAVVRHPMYAGALVMMAATPLALGSLAGLPLMILLVGALAARIIDEERLLAAELPGYADYCRAVRWRLVPFVW